MALSIIRLPTYLTYEPVQPVPYQTTGMETKDKNDDDT